MNLEMDTTKRATWDNSPELRDSVRDLLTEWGYAMRGGLPDLGYPHEQPFSVTPSKAAPCYDADKVDSVNVTLSAWMMEQRRKHISIDKRRESMRLILTLRFHFTSDRPAEAKAKAMNVSKRTFWRRVDEAMYRFWVRYA